MNKDVETRDKIIFGEYNPDKYKYGGIRRFECDADTLCVLSNLGFIDDNEAQNDSPTTRDFLEFLDVIDGKNVDVEFECYAVSPDRSDYRITVEGIDLTICDNDFDLLVLAINNYRYADEFSIDHNDDAYSLRAWWD